jgi:hypothetical protein
VITIASRFAKYAADVVETFIQGDEGRLIIFDHAD